MIKILVWTIAGIIALLLVDWVIFLTGFLARAMLIAAFAVTLETIGFMLIKQGRYKGGGGAFFANSFLLLLMTSSLMDRLDGIAPGAPAAASDFQIYFMVTLGIAHLLVSGLIMIEADKIKKRSEKPLSVL